MAEHKLYCLQGRLADSKPGSYHLELLSWSEDEYEEQRHVEDLPSCRLSGSKASLHLQHLGYTWYPEVLSVWCAENGRVYELRRWVWEREQLSPADCEHVVHLLQSGKCAVLRSSESGRRLEERTDL